MTNYSGTFKGADNTRKSGSTQPRPSGSDAGNPNQRGGAVVQGFVGSAGGPVVVDTGATNSGGPSRGARGGQR